MQKKVVLYHEDKLELLRVIDELLEKRATITAVTNISPITDPHMNGGDTATWLIIYTPRLS